jgi:hypothetical protein
MPVVYSPLNDSELDSICLSLVNQNLPYFSAFHEAFVLLYLTGCRVEEIFAVHRWERLQGYEMMFLPQKDNYWRYVTLDSRCDNFIDAVVGKYKPFGGLSSGQLNSLFYNFSQYSNYKVGSKPVSLYLFRYNFIRKLHNSGLNINQIADKMGYTSTTVVGGYLTAEIEKGFFLDTKGFVNINGTWWSDRDIFVDIGAGNCLIMNPFSVDHPIGYYKINAANIDLILASFPFCRFPIESDCQSLFNFLVSSTGRVSSGVLPDTNFWSSINSYNINSYGLNFIGSGHCTSSGSFRSLGSRCYIPSFGPGTSGIEWYFTTTSVNPFRVYFGEFFNPVRLILEY